MEQRPVADRGVHRNIYYWYYATQVLHNMSGYEWDTWNRQDAEASWSTRSARTRSDLRQRQLGPRSDDHGASHGGRVMMTSLSRLTLEIYYRYLPLFKAEAELGGAGRRRRRRQGAAGEERPAQDGPTKDPTKDTDEAESHAKGGGTEAAAWSGRRTGTKLSC